MHGFFRTLLVTAALGAASGSVAATNLLANGSFEDTPVLNNGTYGRGQLPDGWTDVVGYERPDIVGPGYDQGGPPFLVLLTAQDGGKFIDSNGASPIGGLQQLVTGLTPGAMLSLSFWTSSWAQNSAGSLTMSILDGSSSALLAQSEIDYAFDDSKTTSAWNQAFLDAVAPASGSIIVRFTADSGSFSRGGPGLDNLVLTASTPAVPEPASWAMMIGGLGLAGATLRRRVRGTALA